MIQILLILACMLGAAFFSGMETGVISIHRMRLRHSVRQGDDNARILERFVEQFDRLLGTTLVGTNICHVTASVTAASLATAHYGQGGKALSTVVMALLILLFCEYLPKAWFSAHPLERCRRFAGPLHIASIAFHPVSVVILTLSRILAPVKTGAYRKPDAFVTRDDLKKLAHESERTGAISPRERIMIHRVFDLSNKCARDVMVPFEKMVTVPADLTVSEVLERARHAGFTRLPVFDPASKRFIGILNVIYLLSSGDPTDGRSIRDYIRPPLFIPQDMPMDEILPLMRKARQPLCLVQDREANVIGLMTTENILGEIVGRLQR